MRIFKEDIIEGVKDSIPIILGYFSVSFTFGIMAAGFGIHPLTAGIISLTNVTSAGQFAGITLINNGTTYIEMFFTQLVINLRYALMSLALTQNLAPHINTIRRMIMGYVITDEVFAVAVCRKTPVNTSYMVGLGIGPVISWVAGTICGAVANNLLPKSIQSALGVALYGMFIAIVMPVARKERSVLIVTILAIIISCILYYTPGLKSISSGFAIIICTVVASLIGAVLFPTAGSN